MKDILIIAHFTQAPGEKGNGRFNYIAEKLSGSNCKIEIVTSKFSHLTKKQRVINEEQLESIPYKYTMLYEPGYNKNVSFKRFYSHYILGKNLKQYLQNRKKPDVIYCAVPSLDVAYVAAKYAKENEIRFIIDIQDLWPEAFEMVFNLPILSDIIYYPMTKMANYIYSSADEVIAVSQTYCNRALKVNKKCKKAYSVFLGTDIENFDILTKSSSVDKPNNEIWLAYVGTLGHSYDIKCVIDALKILKDRGIENIKFIVMGDGPLKGNFENYAINNSINVEFTGRLEYGKMISILKVCDIAVNPISKGAAQSIINKHGDYAAAGLPVINTQENIEYRELVDLYKMGLNCINNNAEDVANQISKLINNTDLRNMFALNSRKLAEEKFDRKKTYTEIVEIIKKNI